MKEGAGLSNGLLCTLAVIAGVSVANLYYNQPLLDMLRQDLGTTTLAANHVALFSQLGYALGLLFIIPLADLFSRRRIVLVNFLLLAVSLLAIATASDIRVIHGFSLVTGVCSVIPQIFIPLAAQYSRPEYKNRNVGIVLSGLYKHFVTDQIMDGGNGMENPDQNLFLLDGDGTYVDNSLLWPVLEGTWESPEDGWQAVISEEDGLTLRLDGETVLETPLDFTYIPRKKIQDTGLMLDNRVLQKADGTEWGKILDVYHCAGAGEDSGRLELTVDWSEAADKVVELQKVEE